MVVLVLLAGREGRLLEESDYSMDGLFSLESRSPGRPLLSPLLVRASMFSLFVGAGWPPWTGSIAEIDGDIDE